MRLVIRCLLGVVFVLVASGSRQAVATPLNLVLPATPDILSQFVDVEYDAVSGAFTAHGVSLQIAVAPGTILTILGGSFDISIVTDGTSASGVAGDDLSIVGALDLNGDLVADVPSTTLLTGEIAAFGASTSGPGVFEFVFDSLDGLLTDEAPLFTQGLAGVILGADGNSTFDGSFDTDFSNLIAGAGSGTGSADTAPIPEPGTLLLLGAGIAGLARCGRRTRRTLMAALVAGLAVAGPASATLLDSPLAFPLLTFNSNGTIDYDDASNALSVNADPIALRLAPGATPLFITPFDGQEFFLISITVDETGALTGGNDAGPDLAIFGRVDFGGGTVADQLLLSGEVTGFGFQENGATDLFDFSFDVTGGALAGILGGVVGVSMQSERSTFADSFEASFRGGAKGTLGVIPEPTTLVLLGTGLAGIAFAGRRRAS